jgi:predicted nucleotidyltransferase
MAKPSDTLNQHRDAIRRIVAAHRARNPRVFGSVLRAEDGDASDLDLLVDPDEHMSGFDLGAMRHELESTLGIPVDVLTPRALPDRWRARIEAEAQPV